MPKLQFRFHLVSYKPKIRDGPLENLWGAGEVQKKNSRKGKLNEKNSCKA